MPNRWLCLASRRSPHFIVAFRSSGNDLEKISPGLFQPRRLVNFVPNVFLIRRLNCIKAIFYLGDDRLAYRGVEIAGLCTNVENPSGNPERFPMRCDTENVLMHVSNRIAQSLVDLADFLKSKSFVKRRVRHNRLHSNQERIGGQSLFGSPSETKRSCKSSFNHLIQLIVINPRQTIVMSFIIIISFHASLRFYEFSIMLRMSSVA